MDATPLRPASESTVARGRRFEDAAADHLVRAGYRILARNLRHGHGEVDLVAERDGVVAFVEVKGRTGRGCGHPLEAITGRKRREVEAVARWWARENRPAQGYRFDAIAVETAGQNGDTWCITHVPDAWRPGAGP
jgi:putative endonuclease